MSYVSVLRSITYCSCGVAQVLVSLGCPISFETVIPTPRFLQNILRVAAACELTSLNLQISPPASLASLGRRHISSMETFCLFFCVLFLEDLAAPGSRWVKLSVCETP